VISDCLCLLVYPKIFALSHNLELDGKVIAAYSHLDDCLWSIKLFVLRNADIVLFSSNHTHRDSTELVPQIQEVISESANPRRISTIGCDLHMC